MPWSFQLDTALISSVCLSVCLGKTWWAHVLQSVQCGAILGLGIRVPGMVKEMAGVWKLAADNGAGNEIYKLGKITRAFARNNKLQLHVVAAPGKRMGFSPSCNIFCLLFSRQFFGIAKDCRRDFNYVTRLPHLSPLRFGYTFLLSQAILCWQAWGCRGERQHNLILILYRHITDKVDADSGGIIWTHDVHSVFEHSYRMRMSLSHKTNQLHTISSSGQKNRNETGTASRSPLS